MHAGHEKPGRLEESHSLVTDEGQVEVTRAWAAHVERRTVLPSLAGDRAAAKDDGRAVWNGLAIGVAELLETFGASAERESDDVATVVLFRVTALHPSTLTRGALSALY